MTNPQHEALVEALGKGAVNVERARMSGIAEYLAGWEHLTMRKAADTLVALWATAATPSGEEVRLREALNQIAFLSTNHGGWFETDPWGLYAELGDLARAALGPQAKDL